MLLPLLVHVGADEVQHSQAGQLGEGRVKGFAVGTPEANAHLEGNGVPLHALCQFALRPKLVQRITWGAFQGARFRPFGPHQGSWKDAQGLDVEAAIYAMAKLCLKQETELSELRQEKCFLLHLSAAPHGILKPLIQASLKWNDLRDQMKVDCSLKSELFCLLLKETAARLEKFEQTSESQAAAEKAQWLSNSPMLWLYQKWDPERQALVLDPSRPGVAHQKGSRACWRACGQPSSTIQCSCHC